jgi:two-component system osmolarity sensor histidine kinase EnvZ
MKLRVRGFSFDTVLRKFLPRSLFGRSLLIVLVPLVSLQAVALQIFYGSHLDELSRRLAGGDGVQPDAGSAEAVSRPADDDAGGGFA